MDSAITGLLKDGNEGLEALYALIVLLISTLIGGAFGVEREKNGHAAGLRTHIIISLSGTLAGFLATVFSSSSAYILAGIIIGLAFISMGSIAYNGKDVKGVTTSSTVFATGLIGVAIGLGYIAESLIAAAIILLVLIVLSFVERKTSKREPTAVFIVDDDKNFAEQIVRVSKKYGLRIKNIASKIVQYNNGDAVKVTVIFEKAPSASVQSFADEIGSVSSPLHYDVKTPH